MKERKTNGMTSQRQMVVAGCLMLILVTCFTGLYIARKMEQQNMEAELAKNKEVVDKDVDGEPLQTVDSVILPEVKNDTDENPSLIIQKKDEQMQNNDMDVTEELQREEEIVKPVGGPAVTVKKEVPKAEIAFSGELQWPMEGNVLMNYSMDRSIYFATLNQYKYNPAMIISAKPGDEVKAAAAGTIVEVCEDAQTGLTVVMDIGDGYQASYGQLQDLFFQEGAHLDAGDVIGTVAETTKYYSLEGDNLYFALTKDGKAVDPTEYLPQ